MGMVGQCSVGLWVCHCPGGDTRQSLYGGFAIERTKYIFINKTLYNPPGQLAGRRQRLTERLISINKLHFNNLHFKRKGEALVIQHRNERSRVNICPLSALCARPPLLVFAYL